MNAKTILILRIVLGVIAVFLAYKVYRVIMEPIEFERIQARRYAAVIERLEHIREAEKAYKDEYGVYEDDLNDLIAFIDTGHVTIKERKDSSFMRYDKTYQREMLQDTVIIRVIGREPVKARVFSEDFNPERLRYIPHSNQTPFTLGKGTVKRNNVAVPVFQATASNKYIFRDLIDEGKYIDFIDMEYALEIGSLTQPTLSGNWK